MGGGLMQLVAYGAQDIYLTGNPQITFFKVVYRRHTNFSMESIQQTFNGTVGYGKTVTATISRNGDLVSEMHLQTTLTAPTTGTGALHSYFTNGVGNALIETVELEIGGQRIDKHYSEYLDIWSELNVSASQKDGYDKMVGNYNSQPGLENNNTAPTLYIPLRFWFNRNPGLALPLIALQYHEVKVKMSFRTAAKMAKQTGGTTSTSASATDPTLTNLWVNYIYLDTDERRRFAQVSHEYLIEQVQFTGDVDSTPTLSTNLNLNHPVKELNWVCVSDTNKTATTLNGNNWLNYNHSDADVFTTAKLVLNGHDRFSARNAAYFRLVQNYNHHTCVPRKYIYTYSFALKPEEHQPSGTCNFSRIDNAKLTFTGLNDSTTLKVFATNYNVLRIMSGMGGLAYSN